MSGGVDSSTAAALLCDQGYDVFGVHLRVMDAPAQSQAAPGADARRVAEALGIEFHELDIRDAFRHDVIEPFIAAYLMGQTPNPCVACNRAIKFGRLLEQAQAWGAEALATGHYARVEQGAERWRLLRGRAGDKDQSYYLSRLRQDQLARFIVPLGDMDKPAVRALARQRSLPVAAKTDSQDVCFIPEGDYRRFLESWAPDRLNASEGDIVDTAGHVIGRHRGAWRYTIGQRRGLGVAAAQPLYVVAIDMAANRVVAGPKEATYATQCQVRDVNWVSIAPIRAPLECQVQIRYRHVAAPAVAEPLDAPASRLRIRFAAPQSAITPGQAAVLYAGEAVLASGWIEP